MSLLFSARNQPLPEKLVALLREARWLILGVLAVYVAMILLGYAKGDPGWSHAADVTRVANPGGRFGAWLADLLLYLFGLSAWWLVIALGYGLVAGVARVKDADPHEDRRSLFVMLMGFVFVLVGAAALEALRFHSAAQQLPLAPGGLIGFELGSWVARYFGFTGGTLLLLCLLTMGASLFFGFSILGGVERFGLWLEHCGLRVAMLVGAVRVRAQARQAVAAQARPDPAVAAEAHRPADAPHQPPIRREPVIAAVPEVLQRSEPVLVPEKPVVAMAPAPEPAPAAPAAPAAPSTVESRAPSPAARQAPVLAAKEDALKIEPFAVPPAEPVFEPLQQARRPVSVPLQGPIPPISLLDPADNTVDPPSPEALEATSRLIEQRLADFGVQVTVLAAYPGPVITRYEIDPATGVKGSQVVNLAKDLARALSMISIRVVETVPGKSCMALELPNARRQTVRLSEILGAKVYQDMGSALTVALGKDIGGHPIVADLGKMPHLLVAGTTGSGKSVGVNAMILSLLYKSPPEKVRLIMVDPKMLELSIYEGIPHLLAPVVTDMKHAANALNWCVAEMERRYKLMAATGVRNLAGFNKAVSEAYAADRPLTNPFSISPETPELLETLPHIVVIVDEFADLMMVVGKKVEELIARLAQKARAAGIHLILATQRPSVDVITGLIKANVPTRIAFQVSSKIDSRTILDQMGAEALLGMGDMLYLAPGTGLPTRVHGAFVADEEVHRVVDYLKQTGAPDYVEGILNAPDDGGAADPLASGGEGGDGESDPLYDQAVEVVLKTRRASISLVQRHLRIGYNRSARLIEQMERAGLVSSMGATGNREVLVPAREGEGG